MNNKITLCSIGEHTEGLGGKMKLPQTVRRWFRVSQNRKSIEEKKSQTHTNDITVVTDVTSPPYNLQLKHTPFY